MPNDKKVEPSDASQERLRIRLKRTGLAFLFSAILLIPRLRRLRRNTHVWTLIRVLAALASAWLVWGYVRGTAGIPSLLLAIGLALFSLLVKARPERKSVDDLAREINALVVLNGGSWSGDAYPRPVSETSIFVVPDRLAVFTTGLRPLAEIPLSNVQQVSTRAVLQESAPENGDAAVEIWEMEILWHSRGENHNATFRFQGFFAEHLARIAEQTITSVWKKQLPVLSS